MDTDGEIDQAQRPGPTVGERQSVLTASLRFRKSVLDRMDQLQLMWTELSASTGIAASTARGWLYGHKARTSASNLEALARWLGISYDEALVQVGGAAVLAPERGLRAGRMCSCGKPLTSKQLRYCGRPCRDMARRGERRELSCLECGERFERVPSAVSRPGDGMYCSRACKAAHERTRRPKDALQRKVHGRMRERHLHLGDVGGEIGLPSATLNSWYGRGGTSTRALIASLAGWLGISYEEALAAAGGRTTEDVRREFGMRHAKEPGSEAFEKMVSRAGAKKGQVKSESHRAALSDTARRRLIDEDQARQAGTRPAPKLWGGPVLAAWHRSEEGRAVQSLWAYLRQHPQPSAADVKRWSEAVASRLGMAPEVVRAYWRRHLRDRFRQPGGRPANEPRCRRIRELMVRWPRLASGRLKRGFWEYAVSLVNAAEGAELGAEELKHWWYRHRRVCDQQSGSSSH